jgi:chorismate synthase
VVPRIRSVEPMKDIRRQVERQSGIEHGETAGQPVSFV